MRPSFWPFPPLLLAFPGEEDGVVALEGDVSGVGVGVEGAVEVAGLLVELILQNVVKDFKFRLHRFLIKGQKSPFHLK